MNLKLIKANRTGLTHKELITQLSLANRKAQTDMKSAIYIDAKTATWGEATDLVIIPAADFDFDLDQASDSEIIDYAREYQKRIQVAWRAFDTGR